MLSKRNHHDCRLRGYADKRNAETESNTGQPAREGPRSPEGRSGRKEGVLGETGVSKPLSQAPLNCLLCPLPSPHRGPSNCDLSPGVPQPTYPATDSHLRAHLCRVSASRSVTLLRGAGLPPHDRKQERALFHRKERGGVAAISAGVAVSSVAYGEAALWPPAGRAVTAS